MVVEEACFVTRFFFVLRLSLSGGILYHSFIHSLEPSFCIFPEMCL